MLQGLRFIISNLYNHYAQATCECDKEFAEKQSNLQQQPVFTQYHPMLTVPILSWFPVTSCPAVPDIYSPAAQSTPCPNAACWDYDKSTSSCTLKENSNCFEIDCQATKMIIKFKSTVYGIVDGQRNGQIYSTILVYILEYYQF